MSTIPRLLLDSDRVVALPEVLVHPYLESGRLAMIPVELGLSLDCYGIVTRRNRHLAV